MKFLQYIAFFVSLILIGFSATNHIFAQSQQIDAESQLDFKPLSLNWSPDGKLISVGHANGTDMFDTSLQLVTTLPGDSDIGQSWNSDGSLYATGGGFLIDEGTVEIWKRDLQTNEFVLDHTFTNSYMDIIAVAFSPNDQYLATLSRSLTYEAEVITYTVEIWNTNDWSLKTTLRHQYENGRPILVWSPDSTRIAGYGRKFLVDGEFDTSYGEKQPSGIFIADIVTGDRLVMIDGVSISWLMDDELMTNFPAVNIYDPNTGELLRSITSATGSSQFNPHNLELIGTTIGGWFNLQNATNGTFIHGFEISDDTVSWDFKWSPDGNSVILFNEKGAVQIWDLSNYLSSDEFVIDNLLSVIHFRLPDDACPSDNICTGRWRLTSDGQYYMFLVAQTQQLYIFSRDPNVLHYDLSDISPLLESTGFDFEALSKTEIILSDSASSRLYTYHLDTKELNEYVANAITSCTWGMILPSRTFMKPLDIDELLICGKDGDYRYIATIDSQTDEVTVVTEFLFGIRQETQQPWQNVVLGADGNVYAVLSPEHPVENYPDTQLGENRRRVILSHWDADISIWNHLEISLEEFPYRQIGQLIAVDNEGKSYFYDVIEPTLTIINTDGAIIRTLTQDELGDDYSDIIGVRPEGTILIVDYEP